ncbi:CD4-2 molecule, tandem duplicate 2 [Neoarius graeffei]|uniref:CD4-2 molecule, tandem duplicate 2 n=1 Tax=Neoarius graeffei TaxID=443677 RepID=UPI00298D100E|nr:CD4-2 molecule, tandem duplicate 2 [Neoarius graeffei]XP_060777588.1 CD4-2 molecule, tandem duplicate 2 [Neoarius graeffei]
MLQSKILLWITFDFCVTIGACVDLLGKSGSDVIMNCTGAGDNIEWKLDNSLLIGKGRTGVQRKGKLDTSSRSRIDNNKLKISSLKHSDSGVYTCGSSTYTLSVVSAQANPSVVLHSKETTLSCDIAGGFKGTIEWLSPNSVITQSKDVTIKAVTSDDEGTWTCQINDKGKKLESISVIITVVGPLNTSKEVKTSEGASAELTCLLPAPSKLPITGGFWAYNSISGIRISTLINSQNTIKWNTTDVGSKRVKLSNSELKTDFSVTLEKVKQEDAGMYTCNLEFEGGRSMSANLMLTVSKKNDVYDINSEGSKETKGSMWDKHVGGLQLWVWVAVVASSVVLIGLVVIIVLIHRRNKRMKMKVKKLRSMRQPLTSRNYCKCERTVRQPGTGKKERPPPLPRNQYTSLNE